MTEEVDQPVIDIIFNVLNVSVTDEKVLGQGLLPDILARCGPDKWTLQQDGAPSHTARSTV